MSDERDDIDTMPEAAAASPDEAASRRFQALLALALGVLGALDGGVVATAVQWAVLDQANIASSQDWYYVLYGGVPVLIGVVALALGLRAAGSRDPFDAPVGKVGAVLGAIAVVAGVAQTIAMLGQ